MNKWIYESSTEISPPEGAIGFIYRITKLGPEMGVPTRSLSQSYVKGFHKLYIGKKLLTSNRKGKITKKEIKETGTRKRVKRVIKDSGWQSYNSSCKQLQIDIAEHPEWFHKEILHWCYSKKELSYMEEHEQHNYDVLHLDSWNDTIGGRYYRRDLVKSEKKEEV